MRPGSLMTTLCNKSWDSQPSSCSNICWACFHPASGQNTYMHSHSTRMAPSSEPNITPRKWKGAEITMPKNDFCPSCCCWAFSAISAIALLLYAKRRCRRWPSGGNRRPGLRAAIRLMLHNPALATNRCSFRILCAYLQPMPEDPWA